TRLQLVVDRSVAWTQPTKQLMADADDEKDPRRNEPGSTPPRSLSQRRSPVVGGGVATHAVNVVTNRSVLDIIAMVALVGMVGEHRRRGRDQSANAPLTDVRTNRCSTCR